MKSKKSTTSISDDSDEGLFDIAPARASLLHEDDGPRGVVQAAGATAADAAVGSLTPPSEAATAALIDTASADPAVAQAAELSDGDFGIQALPDTTLIRLDQFRADLRFAGIDGRGLSVAVLDTGIDLDHSYFGADADHNGVADRIVYSYSFVGNNSPDASDRNNHGSNVASIVGSQNGLYTGMAPGVNIIALKVLSDSGSGTATDIAEALNWVVANRAGYNIVAVNMSLGYGDNLNTATSSPFASQFANLAANGTAVVVASGNFYASYGSQGVATPSADPNAWSIGAVWDRDAGNNYYWSSGAIDYTTGADRITSFSQRSTSLTTIFAPGGQITGANSGGGTVTYSGTSQASPHIAGLVADMQQLAYQVSGHFLSVSQLKQTMINGSASIFDGDNENDNVPNTFASYQRVDALGWGVQVLSELYAGTTGSDTLNGTSVSDTIHGNAGNDTLSGNDGHDVLYGDAGVDTLNGGVGNDLLDGGAGNDALTGGAGVDVFYYALGYGADTITDFSHTVGDRINLTTISSISGIADLISRASQVGTDTVVSFGGGDTLTLKNVDKSTLVANDLLVTTALESFGSTKLMQVGDNYGIYPMGAVTGPLLSFGGQTVTTSTFGAWVPIAAEPSGNGYQIAWKMAGAEQYSIWFADSVGTMYHNPSGVISGGSLALELYETNFGQDLNGDGTIGLVTTTIESTGAVKLLQAADTYWLYDYGGTQLRYGGAPVTAGMFGAWKPIAVEGVLFNFNYKVAWQLGNTDQYTIWTTDSAGGYLSQTGGMPGSNLALQSAETIFSQDLNGDGTVGVLSTTLESFGVTKLVQVADAYSMQPVGGSSGPDLHFGGATVTAGQFGAWAPIAAEATLSGYLIVWKMDAADQYSVWTADNSGNMLSNPTGVVSGSSMTVESLETSFSQDLNGDGTVGVLSTTLESFGTTQLVQVADTYSMQPVGGSSGPDLHFGGSTVTDGTFGAWKPIGAEATAGGGYLVAWKMGSADQYSVWTTDANGNMLSNPTGVVSGSSVTLESLETSFAQDLNGDGTTGLVTTVIESFGATKLVQVADTYALDPTDGSSGPDLHYNGPTVTVGTFGSWTPIAAEATAGGYLVAWKMGSADQYSVWTTDANGNMLTNPTGVVSGSSVTLKALEAAFSQDLNGDATIGSANALGHDWLV